MKSGRIICTSPELAEKSTGVRFSLPELGQHVTGFAVRFDGKVYAYVNRCAHVPVELDWNEGEFFDAGRSYLVCATHGALYAPDTGYCEMGPCKGLNLQAIEVVELDNRIMINVESIGHDQYA